MSELKKYIESDDPNYFWGLSSGQHENLLDGAIEHIERLEESNKVLVENYNELIMQVANKFPDESRHETALRYIRQAENSDNQCAIANEQEIK